MNFSQAGNKIDDIEVKISYRIIECYFLLGSTQAQIKHLKN
jgi:hypothetical protein